MCYSMVVFCTTSITGDFTRHLLFFPQSIELEKRSTLMIQYRVVDTISVLLIFLLVDRQVCILGSHV